MTYVYPVVITKTDDSTKEKYLVSLPDFKGYTEGSSLINAMDMARDYIKTNVTTRLADNDLIPKSNFKLPKYNKHHQIATLIETHVKLNRGSK